LKLCETTYVVGGVDTGSAIPNSHGCAERRIWEFSLTVLMVIPGISVLRA